MQKSANGILAYLLLAFGLAWVLWQVPVLLGVELGARTGQPYLIPGAFAPALAAVAVRKWVTREGFTDAGLRPNLKRSFRYYVVAWLLPYPVLAAILGLAVLLDLGTPDFTLARALALLGTPAEEGVPAAMAVAVPLQLALTALPATFILWGEEFGWRGFLQQRLLPGRPLGAAVATGLIWGVWHYPLLLRGYNFPEHPYLALAVFPVSTVLLSIVFGWLHARAGSVWAPSLAHAATNAIGGSLTFLWFAGGADLLWTNYLGIQAWAPLGLLCAWIVFTGRLRPIRAAE